MKIKYSKRIPEIYTEINLLLYKIEPRLRVVNRLPVCLLGIHQSYACSQQYKDFLTLDEALMNLLSEYIRNDDYED